MIDKRICADMLRPEIIRAWREGDGDETRITQQELSDMLNVTTTTISTWESEKSDSVPKGTAAVFLILAIYGNPGRTDGENMEMLQSTSELEYLNTIDTAYELLYAMKGSVGDFDIKKDKDWEIGSKLYRRIVKAFSIERIEDIRKHYEKSKRESPYSLRRIKIGFLLGIALSVNELYKATKEFKEGIEPYDEFTKMIKQFEEMTNKDKDKD